MFHVIPDAHFKAPVAKQADGSPVVLGDDVVKLTEGDQPALDEQGPVDEKVAGMPVDLVGAEKPDPPRTLEQAVRHHAHHGAGSTVH